MNDETKQGTEIQAAQDVKVVAVLTASSGGSVVAISANGAVRELQPGDPIHAGDTVEALLGGQALVTLADGSIKELPRDGSFLFTEESASQLASYSEGDNPQFEQLLAALEAGEDISEKLEETAAGGDNAGGGGAGDEIGQGALFGRSINEVQPQAGFDPNLDPRPIIDPTANTEIIADAGVPAPEDDFIDVIPDDGVIVESGSTFSGSVIDNDSFGPDGPGNPPVIAVNGDPALVGVPITGSLGGTLIIHADGTYEYTPPASVDHSDDIPDSETFTYTVQDSTGDTGTATVTFNIVDTVPVIDIVAAVADATPTTDSINEGGTLNGTWTKADGADTPSSTVVIFNGTEYSLGTGIDTGVGTLTVNTDGTWTFVSGEVAATQNISFSLKITDSDGSVATDSHTLEILDINKPPVAVNDVNSLTEDAGSVSGTTSVKGVLLNDTDVDGDTLTVTAIRTGGTEGAGTAGTVDGSTVLNGTYGKLVIATDGSYTYTLYTKAENESAYNTVQALDDDSTALTDVFNYTMSDGDASDIALLTISITGLNDAPTISITGGTHTVYEAGLPLGSGVGPTTKEVTGAFTLADTDGLDDLVSIKVNDTTFTIAQLSAATVGSPLLAGDTTAGALYITDYDSATGVVSYKYVLDTAITDVPAVTEQDTFNVSVSDNGTTFSAPATITVTIVDDLPVQIIPDDLHVENKGVVGTSDQLISNLNFIAGADGVGSVKFNSADIDAGLAVVPLVAGAPTSSTVAKDADGNELSIGNNKLYLYLSADGTTLTASVGTTAGGTVGYTVTLNASGGTYTFNPEAVISNGTEVTATNLTGVGAGNVGFKLLIDVGGTLQDVAMTTMSGTSVNSDVDDIGIGGGQSFTSGELIRFDLVNDLTYIPKVTGPSGSPESFTYTNHNEVVRWKQQIQITGNASQHADIKVTAINADESQGVNATALFTGDTIAPLTTDNIKIYNASGTLVTDYAAADITVTVAADGKSINITGLKDDWWYEVVTNDSNKFDAIQVEALTTTDAFSLGFFTYGTDSAGAAIDLNYNIIGTDGDGDTVSGTVDVTLYPDALSSTGTNLTGTSGADILLGTNGNDILNGAGGADILAGNAGNDTLTGGQGSDKMSGGSGADTFKWLAGDAVGSPTDTITDFNTGQGDVLDLKALLVGETGTASYLADFLTFSLVGGDTHITVDTNGSVTGGDTQTIVLQGVDLVTGAADQTAIIQSLLTSNSLVTDVV